MEKIVYQNLWPTGNKADRLYKIYKEFVSVQVWLQYILYRRNMNWITGRGKTDVQSRTQSKIRRKKEHKEEIFEKHNGATVCLGVTGQTNCKRDCGAVFPDLV